MISRQDFLNTTLPIVKRLLLGIICLGIICHEASADFDDVGIEPTPAPSLPDSKKPVSPAKPAPARRGGNASQYSSSKSSGTSKSGERDKRTNTSGRNEPQEANETQTQSAAERALRSPSVTQNGSAPVVYSADSLEGSLVLGEVRLEGDVKIEQANAVMKADKAEIYSNKRTTTPQKAIARGRVSLFKGATADSEELRALAREMEYFIPQRRVILKGDPKIWRGPELLQGKVIEVFLDTNEIKVKGARGVMSSPTSTPSAGEEPKKPEQNTGGSKKGNQ